MLNDVNCIYNGLCLIPRDRLIVLENLPVMLCCTACSKILPIMLYKCPYYADSHGVLGSEEEGVKWYSNSCDSRPLACLVSKEGGWSLMAVPLTGVIGEGWEGWEGNKVP